jgi:hypothetical protein
MTRPKASKKLRRTGRPRGRPPGDPKALTTRIAALLAAHPGRAFRAQEVADLLGVSERISIVRPLLRALCARHQARKVRRGLFAVRLSTGSR